MGELFWGTSRVAGLAPKVLLVFSVIGLSLLVPISIGQAPRSAVSAAGDVSSKPLVSFSGVAVSHSLPPSQGLGLDLGANTYSYSSSKVSWARQDGNFTLELLSLSISSTAVALTSNSLRNSSVVEESFAASGVQVGGTTCNPSIQLAFRNMTGINAYDRDVVLSGALGCSSQATITLRFVNALNFQVSDCDTNNTPNPCTSIFFGSMGFGWGGADALQPVYNNATNTLALTVGSSFSIDPVAIDGSGNCTGALTASQCTISLTTSHTNDVIILGQTASNTCSTPTSTPSLTWTQRKDVAYFGGGTHECMYYAVWSSSGSLSVTCKFGGNGRLVCTGFGVTDANTTSIFDGNSAVPCTATGTGSPSSCTLSTSNSNDLIIGLMGQASGPTDSAGSGFTLISCPNREGARTQCAEYQAVNSTQSNLNVKLTWSDSTTPWGIIGDAIKQAYVTQPITCTTANSAPSATMTLSGASVSPTTLACDGTAHNFNADPSQVITITVPTDGGTSRYRLASVAVSTTVTTCASGTCGGGGAATFTIYYQYSQSVSYAINSCDSGATCSAPALTYTQSGSQTQSPLSTTASAFWIDYGTTASVPSPYADSLGDFYYPYTDAWSITAANVVSNPVVFWCGL